MNSALTLLQWTNSGPPVKRREPRFRGLLPPLIVLSATSITIWLVIPGMRLLRALYSGTEKPLLAMPYLVLLLAIAWGTGLAVLLATGPYAPGSRRSPTPALCRRLAIGALWLGPLAFLREAGPFAAPVLGGLAALAAGTCLHDFYLPAASRRARKTQLLISVAAAAVLQSAVIAVLVNEIVVATASCAIGCLAILWTTVEKRRQIEGASPLRFAVNAAVVFAVTLAILYVRPARFGDPPPDKNPGDTSARAGDSSTHLYSGVILRPPQDTSHSSRPHPNFVNPPSRRSSRIPPPFRSPENTGFSTPGPGWRTAGASMARPNRPRTPCGRRAIPLPGP